MILRIESGCYRVFGGQDEWIYDYEDNAGVHTEVFYSQYTPKIGDSIDTVAHVLIPLTGYIINNDPGFQKEDNSDNSWPERYRS